MRLDADTGRTLGMFYHAHRNHDGVWLPAEAMPRDARGSGRPVAFVAFHGAALGWHTPKLLTKMHCH